MAWVPPSGVQSVRLALLAQELFPRSWFTSSPGRQVSVPVLLTYQSLDLSGTCIPGSRVVLLVLRSHWQKGVTPGEDWFPQKPAKCHLCLETIPCLLLPRLRAAWRVPCEFVLLSSSGPEGKLLPKGKHYFASAVKSHTSHPLVSAKIRSLR